MFSSSCPFSSWRSASRPHHVPTMTTTRKCLACKALFVADYRNGHRQAYCPKEGCQLARRRQEQQRRRALAKTGQLLTELPKRPRRLQTASQAREAFFNSQSPVIIGLISMLADSLSREDLEKTLWRLWERGQSVLGRASPPTERRGQKTGQKASKGPKPSKTVEF